MSAWSIGYDARLSILKRQFNSARGYERHDMFLIGTALVLVGAWTNNWFGLMLGLVICWWEWYTKDVN